MSSRILCAVIALFASLSVSYAASPSFDCKKAGTPVEHSICDNPELAELDSQLAKAYKRARAAAADPNKVRSEQRAWVKERNKCRSNVACLQQSYQSRLAALGVKQEPSAPVNAPAVAQAPSVAQVQKPAAQTIEPTISTPRATSQPTKSFTELLLEELGAGGWAFCSSSQIALSAIDARDNSLTKPVSDANRQIGRALGDVRKLLLSTGYNSAQLDQLFTASSRQIRTGDQAFKNVVQCMQTMTDTLNKYKRLKAAASAQSQKQATTAAQPAASGTTALNPDLAALSFLFGPNKRWISSKDVSQSGANCGILLARHGSSLHSEQYTPTSVIGRTRLGGRHPNQNLPKVVMPDTNSIATYSIIATDPAVSFILSTQARNSPAIFTSRWELDETKGSLTRVARTSCQGCSPQMQKFLKMQPERVVKYWCSN